MGQAYTLKLTFADTTGHYLSDIFVVIAEASGAPVLEAVSQGPWFFAKLPPGRYRVRATTLGHSLQQVAQVSATGQTRLTFSWSE
jgi:hypothetical protein